MFNITDLKLSLAGKDILNEEKLDVQNGEHLLLLGPSGCGKTTLMSIMAGLLKPSSGDIEFEEQNYSKLSSADMDSLRMKNFGFVFQKLHLIGHLSVEQNIALAQTTQDKTRIESLISDLGLTGKEKQKAHDLSVGEAQRTAIARAVANAPKVIFADEPTSALDDHNTEKVMNLIFSQAKKSGATVIAATHDPRIKSRFKTILDMAT